MMKRRTRQHEAVDQRNGYAYINALGEIAKHSARGRAVDVEIITDASKTRRNDEGLALDDEADVADEGFVKNRVDRRAVVCAAFRETSDLRAFCLSGLCMHKTRRLAACVPTISRPSNCCRRRSQLLEARRARRRIPFRVL